MARKRATTATLNASSPLTGIRLSLPTHKTTKRQRYAAISGWDWISINRYCSLFIIIMDTLSFNSMFVVLMSYLAEAAATSELFLVAVSIQCFQ